MKALSFFISITAALLLAGLIFKRLGSGPGGAAITCAMLLVECALIGVICRQHK